MQGERRGVPPDLYRSIDVTADGASSLVKLDALTQYVDETAYNFGYGMFSTLAVRNGGSVDTPNLATLRGVNLESDGTRTLAVDSIAAMTSGRVDRLAAFMAEPVGDVR